MGVYLAGYWLLWVIVFAPRSKRIQYGWLNWRAQGLWYMKIALDSGTQFRAQFGDNLWDSWPLFGFIGPALLEEFPQIVVHNGMLRPLWQIPSRQEGNKFRILGSSYIFITCEWLVLRYDLKSVDIYVWKARLFIIRQDSPQSQPCQSCIYHSWSSRQHPCLRYGSQERPSSTASHL